MGLIWIYVSPESIREEETGTENKQYHQYLCILAEWTINLNNEGQESCNKDAALSTSKQTA